MTIMMQKPDATMCQSFTGWKEMGRFVKKGEKGIRFMAPAPYKMEREQEYYYLVCCYGISLIRHNVCGDYEKNAKLL